MSRISLNVSKASQHEPVGLSKRRKRSATAQDFPEKRKTVSLEKQKNDKRSSPTVGHKSVSFFGDDLALIKLNPLHSD